MRTTIDSYKARAGRLDLEGVDFGDFRDQPLSPESLRSLRYMHDIEHHTVCYLRDLLLTPAHQDPEITSFLSCWVYEEMWHGEAIGQVLEAHGEVAGAPPRGRPAPRAPAPAGPHHAEHDRLGRVRRPCVHRAPHDVGRHQRVDHAGRLRTALRDVRASDPARAPPADHEAGGDPHRLLRGGGDPPPGRQSQGAAAHALRARRTGGARWGRACCRSERSGSSSATSSTGTRAGTSWSASTAGSTACRDSGICTCCSAP